MRKIAIIGGKLQGTEAVYLARNAGYKSLLIDQNPAVPASGFCDAFYPFDVLRREPKLIAVLQETDLVLPALENKEVLAALMELSDEYQLKLAFDPAAYAITSSKRASDRLFYENGIPAPRYYPDCEPPYIIKPSGESGSTGVRMARSKQEVEDFLTAAGHPEDWVVQEFLTGDSYSIEIIGTPGHYRTYAVTQIHMDEVYDCRMVTAPCALTEEQHRDFEEIARKLAELVSLHGIMDVEVIDHGGQLKVLEIDARLPSQTPMAVLHATGINMLSELADIVLFGRFPASAVKEPKFCAVEHYRIDQGGVAPHGEHIMGTTGPLQYREHFLGADVCLTDAEPEQIKKVAHTWRATFINASDAVSQLEKKRRAMLNKIKHVRSLTEVR